MNKLILSLLLLAASHAAAAACPGKTADKDIFAFPELERSHVVFKDYEVRIFDSGDCKRKLFRQQSGVEILKGGQRVYTQTGYSFSVGYPYEDDQSPDAFPVPMGTDLTGEGEPDLLVSEYSSDNPHCCFTFHLFRIGKTFGKIQSIPLFDADESDFVQRPGQKGLILDSADYSAFAYFPFGFAGSPAGRVLLSFQKGQFRLDVRRMKANPPTQAEFDDCWKRFRASPDWKKPDQPQPMGMWYYATDLIYTGNPAIAWNFLLQSWGSTRDSHRKYVDEYRGRLTKSVYYSQLFDLQKAPVSADSQKIDWRKQCTEYLRG
jgi:hypothetical protein